MSRLSIQTCYDNVTEHFYNLVNYYTYNYHFFDIIETDVTLKSCEKYRMACSMDLNIHFTLDIRFISH